MEIILVDTRKLGVVIARTTAASAMATGTAPALDSRFYNPTTTGWETPFDAAKHVFASTPMNDPAFANVQVIEIGQVLQEHDEAAAFIVAFPGGGAPPVVIDCWTLPMSSPNPAVGGFTRG